MNTDKKALIEEHSGLIVRIQTLHDYIYSSKSDADNKVEFANKCIQLAAMKKYEECLQARMENIGIIFDNGEYLERVATVTPIIAVPEVTDDQSGSDFDIDAKSDYEEVYNNKK